MDGVPAIIIDPKGDLANLLLTFPGLRGEDFRPWINAEDGSRVAVPGFQAWLTGAPLDVSAILHSSAKAWIFCILTCSMP